MAIIFAVSSGMSVSVPLGVAEPVTLTVVVAVYLSVILGVTVSIPLCMAVSGDAAVITFFTTPVTATTALAATTTVSAFRKCDIIRDRYAAAIADHGAAQKACDNNRHSETAERAALKGGDAPVWNCDVDSFNHLSSPPWKLLTVNGSANSLASADLLGPRTNSVHKRFSSKLNPRRSKK